MTLTINPLPDEPSAPETAPQEFEVTLACGKRQSLTGMTQEQLHELQWEQERRFAAAIRAYPARSRERGLVTSAAYDTVCTILAAMRGDSHGELVMGMDPRYSRLVLRLLDGQVERGLGHATLFEIGYGSGALLEEVCGYGYGASGIEVSLAMREQAVVRLGEQHAESLLLGDVRDIDVKSLPHRPTVIFWNDVFEHIPVDEIDDYVQHLYQILAPSGVLVTITPNWLLRPSDVTGDFKPPRTEAEGLHLKEYRLSEVTEILRRAGFRHIATPLMATKSRFVCCGAGGRWIKQRLDGLLERLPVRLAHLCCRGLAMSCTMAAK